jgi:TolA-binding protein
MPTPATPQPIPTQPAGFDSDLFWDEHKKTILAAVALLLIALAVYAIYETTEQNKRASAGAALAQAAKPEDYKSLIEKYPGTTAAGNAHLLLAKQQRDEKKFDDASATLRNFTDRYPEHPLIDAGWLSLAETQALQGKPDDAVKTYQTVTSKYPTSYSAPLATLAQASLLKTQGKPEDAKQLYENFLAQYPGSTFTQEAMREMRLLRK